MGIRHHPRHEGVSMTDRETLELAAKAIGMEYTEALHALNKQCVRSNLHPSWDPLANDGDALRLAVSLEIAVFPPKVPRQIGDFAVASTPDEYEGGDRKSTR